MFKYFIVSIVIVPGLLAISAASGGERGDDLRKLRIRWTLFALLWFCVLYYLRYRWR